MCRAAKGALSLVTQGPDSNSEHTRVYRSLKVVTINYLFRPGEQLMIGELAERLRVSSTPVRETLIRLQAESLLDTTPRRGFFAKTLNIKEMVDLFQFRFLILKNAIEQTSGGTDDRSLSVAPPLVLQPSEVSETPSTTSTTVAVGRASFDQLSHVARYVESVSECIAARLKNEAISWALSNANDRTHYVRMIDLEMNETGNDIRWMMEELLDAVEQNDTACAIAILARDLDEKVARMPALVKEGISRAYTLPSWTLTPAHPDAVLPEVRKSAMAGKMDNTRS